MRDIWNLLELEPTKDIDAIKKAYAQKAKTCHPEEDPEGFLALREAYQAALVYAGQNSSRNPMPREKSGGGLDNRRDSENSADGWTISDELPNTPSNPLRDGEAIQKFLALYTGSQRKNPKLWMEYFTSAPFLDVGWDYRFTALLWEQIMSFESTFPPCKEFMLWLSIAYRFSVQAEHVDGMTRFRVIPYPEADFDGMSSILRIAIKGPLPKRAGGDELAIEESFRDYRHLVRLAESGAWNDQSMEEFKWIVRRYSSAYIKDRCDPKGKPDYQRHPVGLQIFTHFFRRDDLPEALYRYVWHEFDLKHAVMGRAKILYGPLRDIAAERVSGLADEAPENFLQLNRAREACFARLRANPERADEILNEFFAQKAAQGALRSRRFIEEQLLSYANWLNRITPEPMVRWLLAFYQNHPEIPGWERVVEQAQRDLAEREAKRLEQERTDAVPEELDLTLLSALPRQVYVQPQAGPERVFHMTAQPEWDEDEFDKEEFDGDDAGAASGEPLTTDELQAWFERFAQGELTRLELQFSRADLVLVRDCGKYGCFCFEFGYDTWYSLLSQPEVYQTVDCKDVVYLPFGMGTLASYSVHNSPDSILRRLNLVFMQLERGRIQTRLGRYWLWSSHTSQQNSAFKKRMAMQKLAKIPASRTSDYVLSKFVFSQLPFEVESVSLSGAREVIPLGLGSSGMATASLAQFFQKKLSKLRLSWKPKGHESDCQHLILLHDSGQFMLAWLQDKDKRASFYAADAPRVFLGRVYPACLVHQDLTRVRNGVDLLLDDIAHVDLMVGQTGDFVPENRPYAQIRAEWIGEEA